MAEETTPEVYQLHVWIWQISPMIGRRPLVRSDSTLANLHDALQIVFGWSDLHLHRFRIHGRDYGVSRIGEPTFAHEAHAVRLDHFQFRPHEGVLYEYDFGDGWQHLVRTLAMNSPDNWSRSSRLLNPPVYEMPTFSMGTKPSQ